jgi:5-methylcytosine-specific restriction protein A
LGKDCAEVGDRLFVIRLGKEPKGIIGSGYAQSRPYQDIHYSGDASRKTDYVRVQWDALLDPAHDKILSLNELQQKIPEMQWSTQSSSLLIAPLAHAKLDQMWKAHLAGLTPPPYTLVGEVDGFLE